MGSLIKHADIFAAPASFVPTVAGTGGGYAVLSGKASKWRIKYKGEENMVLDAEGDPRASIELVIVEASQHISKTFYKSGYVEGGTDAPDCQSIDGSSPDPASTSPQCDTCATCPQNQFGSRITPAGKKAKACADSLRLAVVPAGDIANENFGGVMLLRMSATAIQNFASYNKLMQANGRSYRAVVTRVGFDPNASYPLMTFKAVRELNQDERDALVDVYNNRAPIERMLTEPATPRDDEEDAPKPAPKAAAKPAPKPKPAAVTAKPAAVVAKPAAVAAVATAAAPAEDEVDAQSVAKELDDLMDELNLS